MSTARTDPTSEEPTPIPDQRRPSHENRLARETSPYLLQHAHNPVNWYPWGNDAFDAAQRERKPIFLSIGYSTCYWCHVMERESFEDDATAAVLNNYFIPIKVDREERPDIDDIYMTATQLMTGAGGWPMSVFLTPPPAQAPPSGPVQRGSGDGNRSGDHQEWVGLQPFYAGTYFPPEPRFGRPSFTQLLEAIHEAWTSRRDQVVEQASEIAAAVRDRLSASPERTPIGVETVNLAVSQLMGIFDREHGGFGRAPKFPQPVFIDFLLAIRIAAGGDDQSEIDHAIRFTLDRMATGGVYDQVGGGFHRYSTDAKWLVPHFEKMLYDNGQLAAVYARASFIFGDRYYAEIASETCDYVLREMTSDEGAFYSAQDAEVNHREGLNYLWTPDEVESALANAGARDLTEFVLTVYGLDQGRNFQDPHHPGEPMRNVLFLVDRPEPLARRLGMGLEEFERSLTRANQIMYEARMTRAQPGRDDKIIAGWNGLMIEGLAETGRALGRTDYLEAAQRAWRFIDERMRDEGAADKDGADATAKRDLLRTFRNGRGGPAAFAEDYAMLARGLIALHRATGDRTLLNDAMALVTRTNELFRDEQRGGYFDTRDRRPDLFVRSRSTHDGAVPGANSVMLDNLISLSEVSRDERLLEDAVRTLASLSAEMTRTPLGPINATRGLARLLDLAPHKLNELAGGAGAEASVRAPAPASSPASPVAITVSPDEIELAPGEAAVITVKFDIAPGYHINAHDPGDPSLIGLTIDVENNADAAVDEAIIRAVAAYPPGDSFTAGRGPAIRIYEGEVEIPVHIELRDTASAAARSDSSAMLNIVVQFQTCTESECLPPERRSQELRVRIH